MEDEKILKILNKIGLSKTEAAVYLSGVKTGPSTAISIASNANIKRTTFYPTIESLIRKGLAKVELNGFKKLYTCESPERLNRVFDETKKDWEKIIPKFIELYGSKENHQTIKYHKGINSVKSLYENILKSLKSGDDYFIISDTKKWVQIDKSYFSDVAEKRAKLNLNLKIITTDSEEASYYKKFEKNFSSQIKILPKEINYDSSVTILKDKLILMKINQTINAVVIENQSIVDMNKELFKMLWKYIPTKQD